MNKKQIERAFIVGAEWRINSVWHDVKEEPKLYKWLLVQTWNNEFDTTIIEEGDDWENLNIAITIRRWAYIDDLLPDEKEDIK